MSRDDSVEFDYWLTGTGWSKASLRAGDAAVRLTASYLGDALGELVLAAARVMADRPEVRVSWLEEPGEFGWILESGPAGLCVRVLEFDDWDDQPDSAGTVLFDRIVDRVTFCSAVAAGAQRVKERHSLADYRRRWAADDFPDLQLAELWRALGEGVR